MADYTVNAGDLRTKITFQVPTVTQDAGAAQKISWANAAVNPTVWARCVMAHGREIVGSEALKSSQRMTVTVRHRTDIQTTWRVKMDDGTYWQVISLDPVQGRKRWVELVVERTKGTV